MLQHRRADTPLGLVDKAYRPGQRTWFTTLGELKPDGVGMETLLIVGNSRNCASDARMVTPRGYGEKSRAKTERPMESDPGRQILEESFALIDREMGPHALPPWAYAVVRRMIHASADFEFAQTLRYSADFETAPGSSLPRSAADCGRYRNGSLGYADGICTLGRVKARLPSERCRDAGTGGGYRSDALGGGHPAGSPT